MNVGDKVSDLLGKDQNDNEIRISQYKGKTIALYFYPKDNTSGCTAQACSLRDSYQELLDAGYSVIGVSVDNAASHRKFIAAHNLPFPLIADVEKELATHFGVWAEKKMYGRAYMGTLRTTFIINDEGVIQAIIPPKEVNTKEHALQLLKYGK